VSITSRGFLNRGKHESSENTTHMFRRLASPEKVLALMLSKVLSKAISLQRDKVFIWDLFHFIHCCNKSHRRWKSRSTGCFNNCETPCKPMPKTSRVSSPHVCLSLVAQPPSGKARCGRFCYHSHNDLTSSTSATTITKQTYLCRIPTQAWFIHYEINKCDYKR